MNLRYHHVTTNRYTERVLVAHHAACLLPRVTPRQKPGACRVEIEPTPAFRVDREDAHGNSLIQFSVERPHDHLTLTASGVVETLSVALPGAESTAPWEEVRDAMRRPGATHREAGWMSVASHRVPVSVAFADYAIASFTPGRPVWEGTIALTARIFNDFRYMPGSSDTETPVETILETRCGVCQDFAHLQIACLRSLGLAARYVSGYLLESGADETRTLSARATHAWISVFVPDYGWLEIDPTNNQVLTEEYIVLAWGRDYADVSPLRGVLYGGGRQETSVTVEVSEQ